MNGRNASTPVLLYDGTCGFCARSVQFVLAHEGARRSLRFASLESATGIELRRRHPWLATVDSLIWYEPDDDERLLVRSAAVLRVARYLGGVWRVLALLGSVVPRFVRDAAYDFVARHRREIAADACLVPTPDQRARFVDV